MKKQEKNLGGRECWIIQESNIEQRTNTETYTLNIRSGDLDDALEVVADDYEVEDCGDAVGDYEIEEISEEK